MSDFEARRLALQLAQEAALAPEGTDNASADAILSRARKYLGFLNGTETVPVYRSDAQ